MHFYFCIKNRLYNKVHLYETNFPLQPTTQTNQKEKLKKNVKARVIIVEGKGGKKGTDSTTN